MQSNKEEIEEKVEQKLLELDCKLVKFSVFFGKRRNKIEIVIYKENGVSHEDCNRVSREILRDSELDAYLGEDYLLEVSSPGINRKLHTIREYKVFKGHNIEFTIVNEGKPDIGEIIDVSEESIVILVGGEKKEIAIDNIEYAKLI